MNNDAEDDEGWGWNEGFSCYENGEICRMNVLNNWCYNDDITEECNKVENVVVGEVWITRESPLNNIISMKNYMLNY